MDKKDLPVGVFDSGVGGLGVMNVLMRDFPYENFIYIADSRNFPYGTKSEQEIIKLSERIVRYLISVGVKAIVVACNTVSSVAIPYLQSVATDIPVFGMIQAGAELALKTTKNLKIGVISTPLTAKTHAYRNEIHRLNENASVFEVGSQELVNLVEDGNSENKKAFLLAEEKLSDMLKKEVDTLILGCTHFPFLYRVVRTVVGKNVNIVDPSYEVSAKLTEYFSKNNLYAKNRFSSRKFLTTGDKEAFLDKANIFLDIDIGEVARIDI